MNSNLITKFKQLGIIQYETKVHAQVRTKGIGDETVVLGKDLILTEVKDKSCVGYSPRDPHISYTIGYSDINTIGGMTIDRLSKAYDLNLDGTKRDVGLKPGRKPKNVQ